MKLNCKTSFCVDVVTINGVTKQVALLRAKKFENMGYKTKIDELSNKKYVVYRENKSLVD